MKIITVVLLLSFYTGITAQIEPNNPNKFKIGDKAPIFNGVDQDGLEVDSKTILKNQKIVLIFYRGSWCPYCMKHLKDVQNSLDEIESKSAKVIVVTSEAPYSVDKTIRKTGAKFSIISDTNNVILKQFGVDYIADKTSVPRFTDYVITHTMESNNDDVPVLPISSAYIIDKKGSFQYIFWDKDYRNRAAVEEIIKILEKDN